MDTESLDLIEKHCQTILDIVRGVKNGNNQQNIDEITAFEILSSCVKSHNKLGDTLLILLDQLGAVESNEHRTEEQLLISNEEENRELISDELQSSSDKNTDVTNESEVGDSGQQDQANDDNLKIEELDDNFQINRDSLSDNIDTIGIDLQLDTVQNSNDFSVTQDEEIVTTDNVLLDLDGEDAATEPNRKRKLETISDIDRELENILSKQSRQTDETDNIPSAVMFPYMEEMLTTSQDTINWLIEDDESSETFDNNDTYVIDELFDDDDSIAISSDSEDGTQLISIINTNREIHCKNQTVCLLCGENEQLLANHYMKNHPDHEVLVARPSPELAERLRLQTEKFNTIKKGKITGICFFCDEEKTMQRVNWEAHILRHTGEYLYACDGCNTSYELKTNHDDTKCNSEPVNIFMANSPVRSLVGFMCKDCNYLQIERKRMIDHLKYQHGFEYPTEKSHYDKLTLVPFAEQETTESESSATDLSLESTVDTFSSNLPKRKSVTFILSNDIHQDIDESVSIRNTNPDIYFKNQSTCLLCGVEDRYLIHHYIRCHPKREVFIARPSPHMADKLRLQAEQFAVNGNDKVCGICYFCEEIKSYKKATWRQHILLHTGEKIFACNGCGCEVNCRKQHDSNIMCHINQCKDNLVDICEANSSDGSYAGFICNDCNYVQIKLERMIKHLTNEHGYDSPAEHQHYEKYTFLPSICAT